MEIFFALVGIALGMWVTAMYLWYIKLKDSNNMRDDRLEHLAKDQAALWGKVSEWQQRNVATNHTLENDVANLRSGVAEIDKYLKVTRMGNDTIESMHRAVGELDTRYTVMKAHVQTLSDSFISTQDNLNGEMQNIFAHLTDLHHEVDVLKAKATHTRRPRKPNPTDGTENIVQEPDLVLEDKVGVLPF
jgi:predicted  nucleic acid-binding Zn-ribbon protein